MSGCDRKSSSEDFNSDWIEMDVKEEMSLTEEEELISKDIRPTQTLYTLVETKMEIKHEEVDFHNTASTRTHDCETDSDLDLHLETMSRIQHVDSSSTVKAEEIDLKDFYLDLLQCEKECGTCVKYIRLLSEHVRATHSPPQPIRDPFLIDPLHTDPDPTQPDQSSFSSPSIHIKSEVDEDIVKTECSEEEEERKSNSAHKSENESDPDFDFELESGREDSDPDYSPSPQSTHLPRNVRRHGSPKTQTSNDSTRLRAQERTNQLRSNECSARKVLTTNKKAHLTRHNRTETGKRPYACDKCKKSFLWKSNLIAHKRIHTGEKPYECEHCEKSYMTRTNLVDHKRTHTGERPYKCDECEKCYSKSGPLAVHKRTHTGERPYKCPHCEKSFKRSGDLTRHKRIHTGEKPHKCNECEKSFITSSDLSKHKRTHTGEKPYECEECETRFSLKENLIRHMRTHTGETSFTCVRRTAREASQGRIRIT